MRTHRLRPLALGAVAFLALALASCIHVSERRSSTTYGHEVGRGGGGPPPWAPAHGYRYRHPSGVDLVFDARLGVYLVVDLPGVYFSGERFYRDAGHVWATSASPSGPWLAIAQAELPPGLRGPAPAPSQTPRGRGAAQQIR